MISILLGILFLFPAQEIDEVLNRHFQAIGQEYLSAFRTRVIEGQIIQNNQLEYSFVTYSKRPHKARTELKIGDETIIDVYNGENGWHKDFNNQYDLSVDELNRLKIDGLIDGRLSFLIRMGANLELLGKKTIGDKRYYHMRVDYGGVRTNFFINEETYLIFRIIEEKIVAKREITETTYFNYQDFGGIKIPMVRRTIGPRGRIQTIIEEVAFDVAVPESFFQKP